MADVTIDATVLAGNTNRNAGRAVVFTTTLIGYCFLVNADSDIDYYKTTNGGSSWTGPTTIRTGTIGAFDVWYRKWTPGSSSTIIDICYWDSGLDDYLYRSLDTSSGTLGTERTISAHTGATSAAVSITFSRGGNIVFSGIRTDGISAAALSRKSADGGVNWTTIADLTEAVTALDWFHLFPGNEADSQDIWCIYNDRSVNTYSLKVYDDSADSVSETTILACTATNSFNNLGGAVRHSDGHLIVAFWNDFDTVTADLVCYDINGAASITAKTNVVSNSDDCARCSLFIDQNSNNIYVVYLGKSDGSETVGTSVHAYYKKSTDGGANWGAETQYSFTSNNKTSPYCDLGGTDTRFLVTWFEGTANDIITNFDNSKAILAVSVVPTTLALVTALFAPTVTAGGGGITVIPTTLALTTAQFAAIIKHGIIVPVKALNTSQFAATIKHGIIIPVTSLTAAVFAPAIKHQITIPAASLASSSFSPVINLGVIPATAAMLLAEFAPSINVGVRVTPTTLALILAEFAATVLTPRLVTPITLNLTTAAFEPHIARIFEPTTASLVTTGYVPTLVLPIHVVPTTLALIMSLLAPTASVGSTVTPTTLALILTLDNPNVETPRLVTPTTATLATSAFAPLLHHVIIAQLLELILAGLAPSPQTTADLIMHAPTGLVLVTYEPSVTKRAPDPEEPWNVGYLRRIPRSRTSRHVGGYGARLSRGL